MELFELLQLKLWFCTGEALLRWEQHLFQRERAFKLCCEESFGSQLPTFQPTVLSAFLQQRVVGENLPLHLCPSRGA